MTCLSPNQTQASTLISLQSVALLLLVAGLTTGCVITTDDGRDDSYYDETYVDETYVDETYVDESQRVEEEVTEEVVEEVVEEETTTTTTTTVETPAVDPVDAITCSPEDQGFGNAALVESYTVEVPINCVWHEQPGDLAPELGLGFIDIESDEDYASLFDCGSQSIASDVDWNNEVVVYLSGWVPAGSSPSFQWSVEGTDGEVVLGLVSEEVCSGDKEFYQNAFIAPRRTVRPRVISCTEPTVCE